MLKIIVIVLLVIAFVPTVRRFLFWLVVGREMVKEKKKQNQGNTKSPSQKEGNINVDYVPKSHKGNDFKGGQYVDYEEVD